MAEEPDVVEEKTEITLEDFNADEPAKADPSPAKEEPKAEPKAKAEEKPDQKAEDTKETPSDTPEVPEVPTKEEGEPKEEAVETEEKPDEPKAPKGAEQRKTQLNTEIRDLVAQRNALRTEVEKVNAEYYQPATEDELVEQGLTATDAKVEALRQQIEMSDYNARVTDAQLTISSEANRVLQDFAWANPESESYKADLAKEAATLLNANLIYDENTKQPIGSNVSPYQLYKTLDRAANISSVEGQIKGQQATEKQLANVDTNSNVAPPKEKVDPLLELWRSDD